MQKLVFLPNQRWSTPEKRGSSIMRACVIANYMKQKYGSLIDVRYDRRLPKDFSSNDIVIFVKDSDHSDVSEAKRRGCVLVYDPIDAVHTFDNKNKFDIMISASDAHAQVLSINHKIDREKIAIIDHLHTNNYRKKACTRRVDDKVTVGYVGVAKNAGMDEQDYQALIHFFEEACVSFKEVDTLKINVFVEPEDVSVRGLYEHYENIHVGLSLFNASLDPRRKKEKPSTKLSAFASYDIPAVVTYQDSYDPILKLFPEFQNFIADNVKHAEAILRKLIQDFDYYVESQKLFSSIGEYFHMDNGYDLYVNQINKIAKNK